MCEGLSSYNIYLERRGFMASDFITGSPNPGISCTVRWIRDLESLYSGFSSSTASRSLGDGSYVAGGTLLLGSDM